MLSTANPARPALPFTPSPLDWNLHVRDTSEPERSVHSVLQSKVSLEVWLSRVMCVMSIITDLTKLSESNQTTDS